MSICDRPNPEGPRNSGGLLLSCPLVHLFYSCFCFCLLYSSAAFPLNIGPLIRQSRRHGDNCLARQPFLFIVLLSDPIPAPSNNLTILAQPIGCEHSTATMDNSIIQKVNSLYDAVRPREDTNCAYAYSDEFLINNGISLTFHDFKKTLSKHIQPPFLSKRCSNFSEKHPINIEVFDNCEDMELNWRYNDFKPDRD